MTILETPENFTDATTSGGAESSSDPNLSLRRRRTASNSDAAVAELASKIDELESDAGGGQVIKDPGAVMDSETLKSNGKDCGTDKDNRGGFDIKFTYRPSVPAHRALKESPLSSDNIFKQSHAGLFNLCIVVLVAVNSRLIIENILKYGWLIKTGFWFSSRSLRDWPLLMCCLTLPIFSLAAYLVEKLACRKYISAPAVVFLHILISSSAVLYPVSVILSCESAVLSGVTLMLFACIVWLKLVSYAHTNFDMRAIANSVDKGDALSNALIAESSHDVSFKSLVYFMVAPTLCYQPSYPRTASIRKGWVVRQFVKLIIFTGFMGFIIEQYINPIIQNSQHPLKGDLLYAIERVLKLSVPNLYVWLCMFYCFFHLWLNILAELLRFGDREFYKDWWNARTVEEYWRMWNVPVHKWMVRHIYFPCLRHKIPRAVALLITFFVSALFHEVWEVDFYVAIFNYPVFDVTATRRWVALYVHFMYLLYKNENVVQRAYLLKSISIMKQMVLRNIMLENCTRIMIGYGRLCIAVPCHIFKLWAFIGIMFQIPLVVITNYLQNKFRSSMVGNMIFWFIFCILGQPMCVLLYYHDLMNRKGTTESR